MSDILIWAGLAMLLLGAWLSLAENNHHAAQWCIALTCIAWTLAAAWTQIMPAAHIP